MTDEELNAIEQRAVAAKPGPWWVERPDGADAFIAHGIQGDPSETFDLLECYDVDTDYEFIAHAREDVPALIAEIRRLRAIPPGA